MWLTAVHSNLWANRCNPEKHTHELLHFSYIVFKFMNPLPKDVIIGDSVPPELIFSACQTATNFVPVRQHDFSSRGQTWCENDEQKSFWKRLRGPFLCVCVCACMRNQDSKIFLFPHYPHVVSACGVRFRSLWLIAVLRQIMQIGPFKVTGLWIIWLAYHTHNSTPPTFFSLK